jgi:hypothetical protein
MMKELVILKWVLNIMVLKIWVKINNKLNGLLNAKLVNPLISKDMLEPQILLMLNLNLNIFMVIDVKILEIISDIHKMD